MNYRLTFDPANPGATRIATTEAAADRLSVFPTLKGARAELLHRIDLAETALKAAKSVAKVREGDLPDGDAEPAGEQSEAA